MRWSLSAEYKCPHCGFMVTLEHAQKNQNMPGTIMRDFLHTRMICNQCDGSLDLEGWVVMLDEPYTDTRGTIHRKILALITELKRLQDVQA